MKKSAYYTCSNRGGVHLYFEGFGFKRKSTWNDSSYWECLQQATHKCPVRLTVSGVRNEILKVKNEHNHLIISKKKKF